MIKDFKTDFWKFSNKLRNGECFSLSRYSDGELRILQNKKLRIAENQIIIGEHINNNLHLKISPNERKEYDPENDSWFRDSLIEAFKYNANGYYKGLSCRCCLSGKHGMTSDEEFEWQIKESGLDKYDEHLTWANIFLNNNYPIYLEHILPYFWNYDIYLVCNEMANVYKLPFRNNLKEKFLVGENCMINNYYLVDEISEYIKNKNIKNSLFLFSASSLSNILNYKLYKQFPENTYIDIGSTLNPFLGFPIDRRYLEGFWAGGNPVDLKKVCIW